ncbi:MAG: flagellar hook-basal body complex protein, partial [Rubrivivax sp.]|nr:flagellar hook-basal body complex protein [Rubrivivax sp.]
QTFYVKTANPGEWQVYAASDGTQVGAGAIATLNFNVNGALTTAMPLAAVAIPPTATGAAGPSVVIDFSGTTQFGSPFSVNALNQNGYASGRLSGFNIDADGMILGRYTNGESAVLGQVVLANFANPNGLQQLGNNMWAETSASGNPLVGVPSTGSLGVLQSSAVEDSNVDLTAELVNLITAQRVYQANAQTIKAQDAVLQTLVNLR